jgi:hypothetical protein
MKFSLASVLRAAATMVALIGAIVSAIAVAIGLLVFGTILPNLNQAAIGTSAYTLLQQTPVIVAGVALLGIVMLVFGVMTQ